MGVNPGVSFNSMGQRFRRIVSGPTTERLLIIGTAVDGPINRPTRIDDVSEARALFGPASYVNGYKDPVTGTNSGQPAGATIPLAITQAIAAGATDIWVVRATGTYATSPSAFNALSLRAKYPGRIYNDVYVGLTSAANVMTVTLTQPDIKRGAQTFTFNTSGSVSDFCDEFNNWEHNLTVEIETDTALTSSKLTSSVASALATGTIRLGLSSGSGSSVGASTGTNGCRAMGEDFGPDAANGMSGYVNKLLAVNSGTFDTLEGVQFPFDVCVLTGLYLDDQAVISGQTKINSSDTYTAADEYTTSIANEYSAWLERVSRDISPCVGFIAVRPPNIRNEATFLTYITNSLLSTTAGWHNQGLKWTKAGYFMYEGFRRTQTLNNVDVFDAGARLLVVAGPEAVMYHKDIGRYVDQWHVQAAAMFTTIPPERAPISQAVPGIQAYGLTIPRRFAESLMMGVGYDPTNAISGRGAYLCLAKDAGNYLGPQVLLSDCTAAWREDYFSQWQLTHLVNRIESDLANILRPFLGGPTDDGHLGAMRTRAKAVLDGYAATGAFRGFEGQGYTLRIAIDGIGNVLGLVNLYLEINPATAMRSLRINVSVRNTA